MRSGKGGGGLQKENNKRKKKGVNETCRLVLLSVHFKPGDPVGS